MVTDDTDRYPTTSKFPKTRPSELSSKQGESGQEIALVTNYIEILAAPKCTFYTLSSSFDAFSYLYRGFISISLFIRTEYVFFGWKNRWLSIDFRLNYEKFIVKH